MGWKTVNALNGNEVKEEKLCVIPEEGKMSFLQNLREKWRCGNCDAHKRAEFSVL